MALIAWEIVNRNFDLFESRHRSANKITIAEQFVKRNEKYGEKLSFMSVHIGVASMR